MQELWSEWTNGVNGSMPVRELEALYGTKWCDADERRFFNRRRPLFKLVEAVALAVEQEASAPHEIATRLSVEAVEDYRRTHKRSLNWIAKNAPTVQKLATVAAIARAQHGSSTESARP